VLGLDAQHRPPAQSQVVLFLLSTYHRVFGRFDYCHRWFARPCYKHRLYEYPE